MVNIGMKLMICESISHLMNFFIFGRATPLETAEEVRTTYLDHKSPDATVMSAEYLAFIQAVKADREGHMSWAVSTPDAFSAMPTASAWKSSYNRITKKRPQA